MYFWSNFCSPLSVFAIFIFLTSPGIGLYLRLNPHTRGKMAYVRGSATGAQGVTFGPLAWGMVVLHMGEYVLCVRSGPCVSQKV